MSKTYFSVWVSKRESWETRGKKPAGDPKYPHQVWVGLYTKETKDHLGVLQCEAMVKGFKTLEDAEKMQRLLEGPGKKLKFFT